MSIDEKAKLHKIHGGNIKVISAEYAALLAACSDYHSLDSTECQRLEAYVVISQHLLGQGGAA